MVGHRHDPFAPSFWGGRYFREDCTRKDQCGHGGKKGLPDTTVTRALVEPGRLSTRPDGLGLKSRLVSGNGEGTNVTGLPPVGLRLRGQAAAETQKALPETRSSTPRSSSALPFSEKRPPVGRGSPGPSAHPRQGAVTGAPCALRHEVRCILRSHLTYARARRDSCTGTSGSLRGRTGTDSRRGDGVSVHEDLWGDDVPPRAVGRPETRPPVVRSLRPSCNVRCLGSISCHHKALQDRYTPRRRSSLRRSCRTRLNKGSKRYVPRTVHADPKDVALE